MPPLEPTGSKTPSSAALHASVSDSVTVDLEGAKGPPEGVVRPRRRRTRVRLARTRGLPDRESVTHAVRRPAPVCPPRNISTRRWRRSVAVVTSDATVVVTTTSAMNVARPSTGTCNRDVGMMKIRRRIWTNIAAMATLIGVPPRGSPKRRTQLHPGPTSGDASTDPGRANGDVLLPSPEQQAEREHGHPSPPTTAWQLAR